MDDAQAQQTNPLFGIIPKEFFTPLASPNRLVYWVIIDLYVGYKEACCYGVEKVENSTIIVMESEV